LGFFVLQLDQLLLLLLLMGGLQEVGI